MNEMEKWLMLMDDLNEEVITEGSDCPCCDGGRGACSHGKDVCGTCGGSGKVEESVEEAYPMGMAPNAPEDRTEITYNQTKNSGPDAQVTITARAPNMEELKKVLDNLNKYLTFNLNQNSLINAINNKLNYG